MIYYFKIPATFNINELHDNLRKKYHIAPDKKSRLKITYFDTFDWRLFSKNLILEKADKRLVLFDRIEANIVQQTPCSLACRTTPRIMATLVGPYIQSIIDMRALLPVAIFTKQSQSIRILNADRKTVARIRKLVFTPKTDDQKESQSAFLVLENLRGYDKDAQAIYRILIKSGIEKSSDMFCELMESVEVKPGSYSSKVNTKLKPGMPAEKAMRRLLLDLLKTMRQNEHGIIKNIDTEFLHDFRVAIRRTRSALTQVKNVLPPDQVRRFIDGFRELGGLSNVLRDYDVYLLKKDEYHSLLPEKIRDNIDPLFTFMEKNRRSELRKVVRYIKSVQYHDFLSEWEAFLKSKQKVPAKGTKSIFEVSSKIIFKQYLKIKSEGEVITATTPEEALHDLRIECKKLRYLLEFFSSLLPAEQAARLIKRLKKLQDILGDFNDLHLQQENLLKYLGIMEENNRVLNKTSAAVGALIVNLQIRQSEVRSQFASAFNNFASADNLKIYKRLFTQT